MPSSIPVSWTDWHIVIDPVAPAPVRYAANELQTWLTRIAGQPVRIAEMAAPFEPHHLKPLDRCLYVGPSRLLARRHPDVAALKLADEEVLVRRRGASIVLTGGGKRGPLYAVYVFLERFLGCRFFTETDDFAPAVSPALPESFEFRSTPSFATRDILGLYTRAGRWAARLRLNGHFANVSALQGGKRSILPFVHTFAHLVPPSRWFKAHPEYFSLIRGERNPRQLCLSHPRVLELVTAGVLRWIEENPDIEFFSLSENDGGGFCECDACWKLNGREVREAYGHASQPGAFFRFVNRVAETVGRRHPGKWIDTLSYSYYNLTPPRHFTMAPNVIVRVCMNVDGPNRLRQWLKAAARVSVWHYFTYRHFLLPFPLILRSIPTVLRAYHRLGVRDVFLQTPEDEHGGVESLKLQIYAASKLFWDVREDPAPHAAEFIRHTYGPAAPALQAVFDLAQSVLEKHGAQADCWKWDMDTLPPLRKAMPELERRTRPLFERSARAVRGTPYALRVAEAAIPFRYFELVGQERPPTFTAREAYPLDVRRVGRPARELIRTLRALNIRYWHHDHTIETLERAVSPHPLVRLTNRFLDVLVLPGTGGRIVQVFDRRRGRALFPQDSNLFHFRACGYEEYAGHWYHDPGYVEPYKVVGQGRARGLAWVRLRADLSNGFRLERRVALAGREIRIRSVLTNISARPARGEIRLHARWRCDPKRDRLAYDRTAGTPVDEPLSAFVNRRLEGWAGGPIRLRLASLGLQVEHDLPRAAVDFIMVLAVGASAGQAITDVYTRPRRLAPGAALAIDQGYRVAALDP